MNDRRHAATLAEAERLLRSGRFGDVIARLEPLADDPQAPIHAPFLAGVAAQQMGDTARAIPRLRAVLARQPDHTHAAWYLAQCHWARGEYAEAAAAFETAAAEPAYRAPALTQRAACLNRTGRTADAERAYRNVVKEAPDSADALANLASLREQANDLEEATALAERALAAAPRHPLAHLVRATLERRSGDFESARDRLQALLQSGELSPVNRAVAENQLGQALDRLGQWEGAAAAFERSNRVLAEHHPAGRPVDDGPYGLSTLSRIRAAIPQGEAPAIDGRDRANAAGPVFLLGFPRSGTTLLDRMLRAHPAVSVLEERELWREAREQVLGGRIPDRWDDLDDSRRASLRRAFFEALDAEHPPDGTLRIDKLPLNSVYLPLILTAFPDARIIHALRDPRDVILSCWCQLFDLVGAMPYFLDAANAARYYDASQDILSAALTRYRPAVHTIHYEALCRDHRAALEPLLEFLGLEWDPAIDRYRAATANARINTPSYQQVSEPIYQRSIGRWRHYPNVMNPVVETLSPWVEAWGYADGDDRDRNDSPHLRST